jgi:hypothetical protein
MSCMSCISANQEEFPAEININMSALKNVGKPSVMVFPKVLVCLDCGFAQFAFPETELRLLRKREA